MSLEYNPNTKWITSLVTYLFLIDNIIYRYIICEYTLSNTSSHLIDYILSNTPYADTSCRSIATYADISCRSYLIEYILSNTSYRSQHMRIYLVDHILSNTPYADISYRLHHMTIYHMRVHLVDHILSNTPYADVTYASTTQQSQHMRIHHMRVHHMRVHLIEHIIIEIDQNHSWITLKVTRWNLTRFLTINLTMRIWSIFDTFSIHLHHHITIHLLTINHIRSIYFWSQKRPP